MTAPKRYFALFGPKHSGKTVYLGALYGSAGNPAEGGPTYHVAASEDPDDLTHTYLGRIARALRSGAWPDPTAFERLETMTFQFTSGDLAREVVLPDVGGELTQRAVDAADRADLSVKLKEKILAEYADYNGFLVFIPADSVDSSRASEYKWEVDALLNALRERTLDGGTIARPFAVLVTKWDLIEPGPLTDASEARATAYLERTHPELVSGLKVLCANLRVFPVSATGPTVGGLPPVPMRPTNNLGAIVSWLIETSERVRLDRDIAYVERNRANLFRTDPEDAGRQTCLVVAQGRLVDFLHDLPHGPLADEARAGVEELRLLSRARTKRRAAFATAVFGALALVALGYRDNVAYKHAFSLLNNANPDLTPRDVIARVDEVARESFLRRPVGTSLFWWRSLRNKLGTYRGEYESRSFEELAHRSPPTDERDARDLLHKITEYFTDFSDSPRSDEVGGFRQTAEDVVRRGAENRLHDEIEEDYKKLQSSPTIKKLATGLVAKCDSFLKDLPASGHRRSVQHIQVEAQAYVDTQDLATDIAELEVNLTKAANAPLRCRELCAEFLKKHPSGPEAEEIRRKSVRYLGLADDQSWNAVIAFAREYPDLFPQQFERVDAYLANALFTAHRDEAIQFKVDRNKKYDRSNYEAICTRARDGNDQATLRAVRKLCNDYLVAPTSGKLMSPDVERWTRWFDDWTTGKEIHVRVATIRVDRGSIWHHYWWNPDPRVYAIVKVGTKSDRTDYKSIPLGRDVRDLPGDRLGSYTWKWGDPEVTVSLHHSRGSPEDLAQSFDEGDDFKVRHLDGLTTFDGGKIAVRLECPEVVPPELPPYKKD